MTIYDIAKMAGVSASTVSRVINDKPGIRLETRRKVMKIIRDNDFQLNETARGLSTNTSNFVGVLIADIRNAHYTELAYVVQTYLQSHNYTCIIVNAGNEEEQMAVGIKTLVQRNVDGVIIIGSVFQNEFIKEQIIQNMADIPVIFANGYIDLPNVYGVLVDEYDGMKRAVKLLYQRGYKNIAYIGKPYTSSNRKKESGFRDAVTEKGMEVVVIPIETESLGEIDYDLLKSLFDRHRDVDAIVCANDFLAAECMFYCSKIGKKVPADIGFVGINNDKYCEITYPKLTSIDNRMSEMGLMAASTLVNILNGEKQVKQVMLIAEVIERGSIRPAVSKISDQDIFRNNQG